MGAAHVRLPVVFHQWRMGDSDRAQSGNGREWGREGSKEFLEIKAVMGYFRA
jgi:hypothetical protein